MIKPLKNINVVLTRAKEQSEKSIEKLELYGANVVSFPTIEIAPINNDPALNRTISELENYDIIIFTSENSVKYFLNLVQQLGKHFVPGDFYIISIGAKTTELCERSNIQVNFQPKKYSWGFLLEELDDLNSHGKNVLIPCSSLADESKYNRLRKFGVEVTAVPIYTNKITDRNNLLDEIKLLENTKIDVYIFTSPSTFKGFLEIMNITKPASYFSDQNIAAIGPVTKKAINEYDVYPNIIPNDFTMESLVEEIKHFYEEKV